MGAAASRLRSADQSGAPAPLPNEKGPDGVIPHRGRAGAAGAGTTRLEVAGVEGRSPSLDVVQKNNSLTLAQTLRYLPRYVQACARDEWTLRTWRKDDPGNPVTGEVSVRMQPFRCRSRRHAGPCREAWTESAYDRIQRAVLEGWTDPKGVTHGPYPAENLCILVLTLSRKDREGLPVTKHEAFREFWRKWQSLRQWLTRRYGKIQYVAPAEVHRDGWPHMNVLVENAELAADVRRWDEGQAAKGKQRKIGEHRAAAPDWFKKVAVRCGFGWACLAEPVRSQQAVALYLTKMAGDPERKIVGEVVKLTQAPTFAPRHFRTLRASRGFLPPPKKNEAITGSLEFSSVQQLTPRPIPADVFGAPISTSPICEAATPPPPPPAEKTAGPLSLTCSLVEIGGTPPRKETEACALEVCSSNNAPVSESPTRCDVVPLRPIRLSCSQADASRNGASATPVPGFSIRPSASSP